MAGNASDDRRRAEAEYKSAKRDDPQEKNAATRTLKAAFNAAKSVEQQQTGSSGQANFWNH